jgi:hypothetical protein
MELNILLTEVFLLMPGGVLSIHQVSKKLEIPYGTAYNRIHELGRMGVVHIIPQGKAKLCTLNSDNPMTSALLGLGAAQATSHFLRDHAHMMNLVQRTTQVLEQRFRDTLHTAILLNADALTPHGALRETPAEQTVSANAGEDPVSLDLFLVVSNPDAEELEELEHAFVAALPQYHHLKVTKMVVSPSTLSGMLEEKENDAGTAAFQMLRKGLLLTGFDRFYQIVLKAFRGNPFRT